MSVPIWSAWRAEKERSRRRALDHVSISGQRTRSEPKQSLSVRKVGFGGQWVAQYGKCWSSGHTDPLSAVAEVLEKAVPSEPKRLVIYGPEWRGMRGWSRGYAMRYMPVELHRYYTLTEPKGMP